MIRLSARLLSTIALIALFVPALGAVAQQHVPPAPGAAPQQGAPAMEQPAAPAPATVPVFPKVDPANFTAATPTKEVVDSFLQANWGYDDARMWQVQAILKTPADGVSKVIVLAADKGPKPQISPLVFFALPDGKHIIAGDSVINFGAHPFAEVREQLQQRAEGPYRGSASKDLELVEFADFQCPHCKEAQANMEKLGEDFPKARIVLQLFSLASIHPDAVRAAEYGLCVNKMGGNTAFFQFAAAVFDGQDGLGTADGATLTINSAVTKAGLDPAKVATCTSTPEIKTELDASTKLANDMGINQVPTLVINGRQILANAPYDLLKKMVEYQAKADGVAAQ